LLQVVLWVMSALPRLPCNFPSVFVMLPAPQFYKMLPVDAHSSAGPIIDPHADSATGEEEFQLVRRRLNWYDFCHASLERAPGLTCRPIMEAWVSILKSGRYDIQCVEPFSIVPQALSPADLIFPEPGELDDPNSAWYMPDLTVETPPGRTPPGSPPPSPVTTINVENQAQDQNQNQKRLQEPGPALPSASASSAPQAAAGAANAELHIQPSPVTLACHVEDFMPTINVENQAQDQNQNQKRLQEPGPAPRPEIPSASASSAPQAAAGAANAELHIQQADLPIQHILGPRVKRRWSRRVV